MENFRKVSVAQELERTSSLQRTDIQEVLDWLEIEMDLPKLTESEVILFLHSNYYDIDATKDTIRKYFDCRTDYREFFSNLNLKSDQLVQVSETM